MASDIVQPRTNPFLDDLGPIDRIDRELSDAYAQIVTVTGEGFAHFSELNEDLQHEFLFSIYNRIRAARAGFDDYITQCGEKRRAREGATA